MNKIIQSLVVLISIGLLIWDVSIGLGWLIGMLFMYLLERYREDVLNAVIGDFTSFSTAKYIAYLLGVILWILIPVGIALFWPNIINPWAIFACYLFVRWSNFFTLQQCKRG